MKKTSFLKGLAMATVAFAAVLTSCSKEDFNINVKPNDAKIYFSPSVIDPVANATVEATFEGAGTITGTPNIPAGSVTITAKTANGATGSATVKYDAVEAGSVASYSPVIYLNNGLFTLVEKDKELTSVEKNGKVNAGHSHNNSTWFMNQSDYSAKFVAEWDETAKTKVLDKTVEVPSAQLEAYLKSLDGQAVSNKGSETFSVSAWGMVKTVYTLTTKTATYDIVSTENKDFVVGQVKIEEPLFDVTVKCIEEAIPGHADHYEHGHSHGEGTNAGGGMGWAE